MLARFRVQGRIQAAVVLLTVSLCSAAGVSNLLPASASRIADVRISGILPNSALQGETIDAEIRGRGFETGATVSLGDGVTVEVESVDARGSSMAVTIAIDADATPGARDLMVTNPGGETDTDFNSFRIEEVLPAGPQFNSLSPTKGQQGQTLNVTLNGLGFVQGATVSFGQGINVNSAQVSSVAADHILTCNITIDPSAALGKRDVSVRNPGTQATVKENSFEVVAAASGKLVVAPKKLKFPAVKIGKIKSKKLKIKNTGEGVLNGTITAPAEGSGFVMNPVQTEFSLKPGATLILNVEFHPTEKGKKSAEILVTSDDPDKPSVTVPIKGKGK